MSDGSYHYQAAMSVTVTTTGNIDDLDVDGAGMLIMNNGSASTIRGIQAGYHGQILGVISVGAGSVTFNHQDTNSSAANRIITDIAAAVVLVAGSGGAFFQYDAVNSRWRLLAVAYAGNIKFPATQNASSDANTLDDYEEGTWTPADGSGAGLSLTVASARYTKVGRAVAVCADLTYPATADASAAIISGLPFTAGAAAGGASVAFGNVAQAITFYIRASTANVEIYNVSGGTISNATLTGKTITLAGVYFT